MIKAFLKDSGAFQKIFQLIIAFFVLLIFTTAVIAVVTQNDTSSIGSLKIMQLIQAIGLFILPPLVLAYLWSEKPLSYLGFTQRFSFSDLLLVSVFMLVAIPFINLITSLNQLMILPDILRSVVS